MIKNQKQAAITREKIKELKTHRGNYASANNEILDQLAIDSLEGMINELEEELELYDSLVSGNFHCLKPKSLNEIPNILIGARLAQKLSQKELADIVGVKEQQIQRYESTDYETASWPRIVEISFALNLKLSFEKVIIINTASEELLLPEGVSMLDVENASLRLKKQKSLIFN